MEKKNKLEYYLATTKGRRTINYIYSWGAAVVIIGALAKILHWPFANIVLMVGMIVEACVFFISGFDSSEAQGGIDDVQNSSNLNATGTNIVGGSIIAAGSSETSTNSGVISNKNNGAQQTPVSQASTGGGTVVIAGGGNYTASTQNGGNTSKVSFPTDNTQPVPNASQVQNQGNLGNGGESSERSTVSQSQKSSHASVYVDALSNAGQDVEYFARTMDSLNEMSSVLLNSYQQIMDSSKDISLNNQSFVANMKSLNENIVGLNTVYESQLQSISDQISTVKFINESLDKIKHFYSDTLIDSSIFKEETEKMTKQIEALNQVYARMLRAMTTNGNSTSY